MLAYMRVYCQLINRRTSVAYLGADTPLRMSAPTTSDPTRIGVFENTVPQRWMFSGA